MELIEIERNLYKLRDEEAYVISSPRMLEMLKKDRTIQQLSNVAKLPGLAGPVMLMPDAHEGYGFPIGAVAAFDSKEGIVSPGGVGYDINCGVRLAIVKGLKEADVRKKLRELVEEIYKQAPSGVGSHSKIKLTKAELEELTVNSIDFLKDYGFVEKDDPQKIEENGRMENADPNAVSETAKMRGKDQVGSIGSGNHFIEIQRINEVFDEELARAFNISEKDEVGVMIHSGSRGFGHQVCSDYLRVFNDYMRKNNIKLTDRELVYGYLSSEEAQRYLNAMACAVNFAFCNRQLLLYGVRKAFQNIFGTAFEDIVLVYDVAHNIAKFERHRIRGKHVEVCVHRKGATRAFAPNHEDVPVQYRKYGQPVIIPGSMGTASYLLAGTQTAMELTYGSTCHGAGRTMSRKRAIEEFGKRDLTKELLTSKGIMVKSAGKELVAEEAPGAYKDIDLVVEAVTGIGIAKKVAKLTPMGVVKG